MTPTREEVAEALVWGNRRPQYITTADDLANRDRYHDADDVERHVETLVVLCRMQHEALAELVKAEWMVSHNWGGDRETVMAKAEAALALMPTEGESGGSTD